MPPFGSAPGRAPSWCACMSPRPRTWAWIASARRCCRPPPRRPDLRQPGAGRGPRGRYLVTRVPATVPPGERPIWRMSRGCRRWRRPCGQLHACRRRRCRRWIWQALLERSRRADCGAGCRCGTGTAAPAGPRARHILARQADAGASGLHRSRRSDSFEPDRPRAAAADRLGICRGRRSAGGSGLSGGLLSRRSCSMGRHCCGRCGLSRVGESAGAGRSGLGLPPCCRICGTAAWRLPAATRHRHTSRFGPSDCPERIHALVESD